MGRVLDESAVGVLLLREMFQRALASRRQCSALTVFAVNGIQVSSIPCVVDMADRFYGQHNRPPPLPALAARVLHIDHVSLRLPVFMDATKFLEPELELVIPGEDTKVPRAGKVAVTGEILCGQDDHRRQ